MSVCECTCRRQLFKTNLTLEKHGCSVKYQYIFSISEKVPNTEKKIKGWYCVEPHCISAAPA